MNFCGPGQPNRYSDSLRVGRSGDRILVVARFFQPVQTGPGANPSAYTTGTGPTARTKKIIYILLIEYWKKRGRQQGRGMGKKAVEFLSNLPQLLIFWNVLGSRL